MKTLSVPFAACVLFVVIAGEASAQQWYNARPGPYYAPQQNYVQQPRPYYAPQQYYVPQPLPQPRIVPQLQVPPSPPLGYYYGTGQTAGITPYYSRGGQNWFYYSR